DSLLSDESRALLDLARKQYTEALAQFEQFRTFSADIPDPNNHYARVYAAFKTLTEESVQPLIEMVSKGEMAEYHSYLSSATLSLEQELASTVDQVINTQQTLINDVYQNEAEHYQLVVMLVAVAIAGSLL